MRQLHSTDTLAPEALPAPGCLLTLPVPIPIVRGSADGAAIVAARSKRDRGMTARRRAQKARTKIAPAREDAQRGKTKGSGADPLKVRLSALERERDALRAELQRAEARVRDL